MEEKLSASSANEPFRTSLLSGQKSSQLPMLLICLAQKRLSLVDTVQTLLDVHCFCHNSLLLFSYWFLLQKVFCCSERQNVNSWGHNSFLNLVCLQGFRSLPMWVWFVHCLLLCKWMCNSHQSFIVDEKDLSEQSTCTSSCYV